MWSAFLTPTVLQATGFLPDPEACCGDETGALTPGLPAACRDVLADPLEFVTQEGSGHFGDMYSVHQGAIIHYAKVWVSASQRPCSWGPGHPGSQIDCLGGCLLVCDETDPELPASCMPARHLADICSSLAAFCALQNLLANLRSRFGQEGLRVFRTLVANGQMEQKYLAARAMLEPKASPCHTALLGVSGWSWRGGCGCMVWQDGAGLLVPADPPLLCSTRSPEVASQ